jgi:hypothetical protein
MIETRRDDDYAQFLQDFGARLDAAAAHVGEPRRHRRMAAGALALAGASGGTLALTLGGGAGLDVVARAQAALLPDGQIVHLVTTSQYVLAGGSNPTVGTPWVSEQWSTSNPTRWHVATAVPAAPYTTPDGSAVSAGARLVSGALQFSYASGTAETYFQQGNVLEISSGLSDDSAAARRGESGLLGLQPVEQVRSMLMSGELRDAGSGTADGRVVDRLTGEQPDGTAVEYDVDPSTYAPVRVVAQLPTSAADAGGNPTEVVDVNRYEEIPLSDAAAPLLSIQPPAGATVQHFTP